MKRLATSSKALDALAISFSSVTTFLRSFRKEAADTFTIVGGVGDSSFQTFKTIPKQTKVAVKGVQRLKGAFVGLKKAITGVWAATNKLGFAIAALLIVGYGLFKWYKKQEDSLKTANT